MTKLETITAEDLQNRTYEPTPFLVDELIPEGLHILAGAPKIGKSWLALWLCLCVAQGQTLWNFTTTQGEVLYLSLEDSYRRIQSRLFDLTEDAPSTLHFAIMADTLKHGLEQQIAQWAPKAELTGVQIAKLEKSILRLEDEMEAILMERIRDRSHAERYDRMIQKREEEIAAAKKQIEELQNISAVLRDRQTKLKRDIGMIDDILAEGVMTEAHLRMLVEKIYVQETDGKLSLDIQIKAPFRTHLDVYENGTLTERYGALDFDWDRLARLLYGDGLAG